MFNYRWTKQIIFILLALVLIILGWYFVNKKTVVQQKNIQSSNIVNNMILNSTAFKRNDYLPAKYSCDGLNVNPPLKITEATDNAASFVLIVNDPDAVGGQWTHWLLWNIPPATKIIEENSVPEEAIAGPNDFGEKKYSGPCPPAGIHHYVFELYALDIKLNLPAEADKNAVMNAMTGHIIAQTELTGLYSR